MAQQYLPRTLDRKLDRALQTSGAVLIEGPKWCGKTRTAEEKAASVLFMQDPDHAKRYLLAADVKPSQLLEGEAPRLIDEWQLAPVLWDAVRFAVDRRGKKGQFILTGSAVPTDDGMRHTGTGRILRLTMRPMSLFESQESSGEVSLEKLFDGGRIDDCLSSLEVDKLAFILARGGWPEAVLSDKSAALAQVYSYLDAIVNADISDVDGVKKDPARVRALLHSLARNTSSMANFSTIKDDIRGNEETISEKTIAAYLSALRRLYVTEDLPAWSPAMRSKAAIRTSVKRHFSDPSIAVAALRGTPDKLLDDFETFGFLFESLCVRDLRIYADAADGDVFHYRDKSGLEADAVVQLRDGRWGAIEVKMGASKIDEAAKNLIELRNKVDTVKMQEPSFLMVLTAAAVGYTRPDGVHVVPIGCLRD